MISVACDVCAHKYQLSESRYGQSHRCRECESTFLISDANQPLEPDEGGEAAENPWLGFWRVMKGTLAGIAILAACGWMTSLVFRDPWNRPALAMNWPQGSQRSGTYARPAPQYGGQVQTGAFPAATTQPTPQPVFPTPQFQGGASAVPSGQNPTVPVVDPNPTPAPGIRPPTVPDFGRPNETAQRRIDEARQRADKAMQEAQQRMDELRQRSRPPGASNMPGPQRGPGAPFGGPPRRP